MEENDKLNNLDKELLRLTCKINEISIEVETFKYWKIDQWDPFIKNIYNEYRISDSSDLLKSSIDEYFNDKLSLIMEKLLKCNFINMSICLRQLLIDIKEYILYLENNDKNKKFIKKNIDNYDDDKKINDNSKKRKQDKEKYSFFKESEYISYWSTTLFKKFENDNKKIKDEINNLKNHLSISLHSNTVLYTNNKWLNDKEIEKIIYEKIDLINKNLIVYNASTNNYETIDSNESLEYKNYKDKTSSEFFILLSPLIEFIKNDFSKEYDKLIRIESLKG